MPGRRLTAVERAQIEVLYGQGYSFAGIGRVLRRSASTIAREVARNGVGVGRPPGTGRGTTHPGAGPVGSGRAYRRGYQHVHAQARADRRARRPQARKLRPGWGRSWPPLWYMVKDKLRLRWSPTQIACWLRDEFPDRPEMRVSHETIYQAIYFQARGGMRAELARQVALRSGRTGRRPRSRAAGALRSRRPWTTDLHISTRPAEVADRAVPGHWEGDLLQGARGASAIITLVERHSRYLMLGALPDSRVSDAVIDVLIALMRRLPAELRKTLTWDQGGELARHARFTLATDTRVYFCDPHSPWQRGSNENTNGLLRQYFPREPLWVLWRLHSVRRWSDGRTEQVLV
jgi:transposase, IS30 family